MQFIRKFWPYAALVAPAIALMAGFYLYFQAPEGLLLYTPAPNVPARYAPSFQIGFSLAALAQIVLYALLCLLAWLLRKREVVRMALSLLAVSGVLLGFSMLPESWWAHTSPHVRPSEAALLTPVDFKNQDDKSRRR